ncbi:pyridoxamine 5'-phosphate oxidase [Sinorhizobium fredii USDA 205]|uniref:Flavin-nucleotide-binding protein n=1 Tax=Rhizobium fredii TaxID=380 RepID=A0A844A752_RHIFR|nr:pyridoxamine 5'-phosphate oxidase family protein [Sinorhizobium fredii]ASY72064.1 Flavohemoprotein (Hemoglobin-like protein) (Flavohemoglobin) (Nitric oxide dioxygenase) [Sinorhizobium fredii CCBAU 83666]KSV84308.1 pyridoxamine 5'-phosphate oxidase [Sinorhizobium fredii USDA 205]MQX08121.1 flavin-nucleotide-binding protein [Sinorhizobium fredii]GEC30839.1 pyridoxamine 5'-phosphate oxidase [Sinorhizobium fredii]GLS10390.1 pyridoxamine 5'-phosphate oxidase [Sinorhizobium fredii]
MDGRILPASPWHDGEIKLQRQSGVETRMDEVGRRVLRDHLIEQHREFYPLLPMVVLGAVDQRDDPWATLRAGRPGFLRAPDAHRLTVELSREPADPADGGMEDGASLALLGIDLGTRRRNRLNGRLDRHARGFDISVDQSFGNCPKYIQLRQARFIRDPSEPPSVPSTRSSELDDTARALVGQADTFFVATYADLPAGRQVDVSHRGGRAGFVRVGDDDWLTIPDFVGNRFFNTLGNIAVNPRAGLVFPDFSTGGLLQMTGEAELLSGQPEGGILEGAERYWRFRPRQIVWRADALPICYDLGEWSPFALATGTWSERDA